MESTQAPTQSKKPLIIIAIVAAVLLLCCICIAATGLLVKYTDVLAFLPFFGAKQSAAKIMPADTALFVSFDPDVRDSAGYKHLAEVYGDAFEDQETIEEVEDSLLDEYDISFEDDILPWLGPELGMALTDLDDLPEGGEPNVAFVAESRDRGASDAFLEKLRESLEDQDYEVDEETYEDVTYYVQEVESEWETPMVFGSVGNFVVLATDPSIMEEIIDTHKGESDSLASNEIYNELVGKLPSDASAIFFYDMQDFADLAMEDTGVELSGDIADTLEAYKAFGIAISLDTEGIQLDFAVTLDPEKMPSGLLTTERAVTPDRILQRVPSSALGFVTSYIPSSYWENLQNYLEQTPDAEEQLGDFEESTGLSLDEMLGWITGELAIVIVEAETAGEYETPIAGFSILEASDMEKAHSSLEDVAEVIEEMMYVEFEDEEIGDLEMQVIVDTYSDEIVAGYGFTDEHVIIGVTESGLETATNTDVEPITNDEVFQAVRAHLPSDNTGYMYVNVDKTWRLIYDTMSEYDQEYFDEDTRPYLEPIKAIGLAGTKLDPQQGLSQATLFIYIP